MPAKKDNRPSAVEAVAAVMAAHPNATAAELADAAGVGQSTATKALAALEAEGRARRLPGGRGGNGRRQPDRWLAPEPPAPATGADANTGPTPRQGRRPGDEYMGARLSRGELTGLVLEYLAARPAEALGPAAVAKSLGRSAGAVSNALGRLAQTGSITLIADSPRRYRLTRPR
jgi:Mn-dependent DtxR family transcriptional regulator